MGCYCRMGCDCGCPGKSGPLSCTACRIRPSANSPRASCFRCLFLLFDFACIPSHQLLGMTRSSDQVKTRSGGRRISYKEPDTDDEYEDVTAPEPSVRERTRKRVRISKTREAAPQRKSRLMQHAPQTNAKSDRRSSDGEPNATNHSPRPGRAARPRRGPPVAATNPVATNPTPIESDGVIPAWHLLPYEILLTIFRHAALPLSEDGVSPSPSVRWLLGVSRMCRAFAEPALTVLYECPPLFRTDEPHLLFDLLTSPAPKTFDYANKIKRLQLDVFHVLQYAIKGRGQFELQSLTALLPQLGSIEIKHSTDRPPFRFAGHPPRWSYPLGLFTSLQENATRLKGWRWHQLLMDGDVRSSLGTIHSTPAFSNLQSLYLSHFSLRAGNFQDSLNEMEFAAALTPLTSLKDVTIQSCWSIDWDFLASLPTTLTRLAIINCPSFHADFLRSFLESHGSKLKDLQLDHDQSLDLSFLPGLKVWCPTLESLHMDLTYYSTLVITHRDDYPNFDKLLGDDDVPTWPSTLHTLELLHLRNWSSQSAETFFASLIGAAGELRYLRKLVIKAILDIGWRDRAGFREEWISRLRKVFLREAPPPDANLASAKVYRGAKAALAATSERESLISVEVEGPDEHMGGTVSEAAADSSKRRSKRIKVQEETALEQSELAGVAGQISSSGDSDVEMASGNEWKKRLDKIKHGMCEIVDISIDNMRPTENRFTENDFMDSEHSGDEEYRE